VHGDVLVDGGVDAVPPVVEGLLPEPSGEALQVALEVRAWTIARLSGKNW
jgi:hypothetical protein